VITASIHITKTKTDNTDRRRATQTGGKKATVRVNAAKGKVK